MKNLLIISILLVGLFACASEDVISSEEACDYVVGPEAAEIRNVYVLEATPLLILYDFNNEEFPFEEYEVVKFWNIDHTRVERLVIYYEDSPIPIYDNDVYGHSLYYSQLPDNSKILLIHYSLYPRGPSFSDLFINGDDIFSQTLNYLVSDYEEIQELNDMYVLGVRLWNDNLIINSFMGDYLTCYSSYWSTYNYINQELVQYGPDEWISNN